MPATTRRTKYSETLSSIIILGILVTIGLVIIKGQNRFNPAVHDFSVTIDATTVAPQALLEDGLAILIPEEIRAMSPAERFDPETLSDKINGKAELYLSAGFVELTSQRFQAVNNAGTWFEAFIYDMQTPSNAFAVFSNQRRRGTDKLAMTRNAYATENAVFFTKGHFYVELIAATAGPETLSLLTTFAKHYLKEGAENKKVQEDAPDPQQLFPTEGMIVDSFTLIAKDAFGFDRLDQIYTVQYRGAETETTLFVSKRSSLAEADTLAASYRDFLVQFGGNPIDMPSRVDRKEYLVVDILDAFEIVFSNGQYLAGVHMAEDQDAAFQLALALDRHLELTLDRSIHKE